MNKRRRWLLVAILGAAAASAVVLWPRDYCRSAKRDYGIEVPRCPSGTPRQTVRIHGSGLRRAGQGSVTLVAEAAYLVDSADYVHTAPIPAFQAALALVDASGKETPLEPMKDTQSGKTWSQVYPGMQARIELPDVRDGDYLLRARVRSRLGESTVELPLALYAPARIHVLTDRPLYEPGNQVQFRALALRARDLTPIDYRPGTWLIMDPAGEILLEEKAPAGEWGVVSGAIPIDRAAPSGQWSVVWRSGNDEGRATFTVEPFTLPRFRVEASASEPFYGPGMKPTITGQVVYSSGAPVAGAAVELAWSSSGAWPPPTDWLDSTLPKQAKTNANGSFTLALPEVPYDLQGQATLQARMTAVDPAGDRVTGAVSVLFSQDPIQVSAVSELGSGLVEGANNRVYLRVTTADGRPLPGAQLQVRRAWASDDPGIDAVLDEDSVARIQLDPGPPVSMVIPPMPVRAQPRAGGSSGPLVQLTEATELITQDEPSMADRMAMDRWLAPLEACAAWVQGDAADITLGLRVSPAGAIVAATSARSPLARCAAARLGAQRLPAGADRLYAVNLRFEDPALPVLQADTTSVSPSAGDSSNDDSDDDTATVEAQVDTLITEAALAARGCLPRTPWNQASRASAQSPATGDMDSEDAYDALGDEADPGDFPLVLDWRVRAGQTRLTAAWIRPRAASSSPVPPAVAACVLRAVQAAALAQPATRDAMGVVHYAVQYPDTPDQLLAQPQPTVMLGYELLVSATQPGSTQPIGQTRLRMQPGQIPQLRLRADPVLATPGQEVTLTLLRGPSFRDALPDPLTVQARSELGKEEDIAMDKNTRTARYQIPADARGWLTFLAAGERALVYIRSAEELTLAITPGQPRYAPGTQATLALRTQIGGQGAKAAVGLVGVDQTLGQLAALPGPDELGSIRPEIRMTERAFGSLDAQALTMGRIRGSYAAEATILRVSDLPTPADLDIEIHASAETSFDPLAELTDRFYIVLAELHAQARAWEASAPADELMQPATMAKLWNQALGACEARGEVVKDAFGRRLRLHYLPADLLALTDPQHVIAVGTRLPEDVENWSDWVARNQP